MVALIAVLLVFADRPIFWRECSSGLSKLAFFFARVVVKWVEIALFVVLYTTLYYLVADLANLHFMVVLYPNLLLAFVASGWACHSLVSDPCAAALRRTNPIGSYSSQLVRNLVMPSWSASC